MTRNNRPRHQNDTGVAYQSKPSGTNNLYQKKPGYFGEKPEKWLYICGQIMITSLSEDQYDQQARIILENKTAKWRNLKPANNWFRQLKPPGCIAFIMLHSIFLKKTRRNQYNSNLKNNQVLQEANWYYQQAEKKKIGWTNATNAKHADKAS